MPLARWPRCATSSKQAPVLPELHGLYVRGNGSADDLEVATGDRARAFALCGSLAFHGSRDQSDVLQRAPLGRSKKNAHAEVLVRTDPTLLEWGRPVYDCETVLADLRPSLAPLMPESACRAGIELVDLRTVLPWDVETINYLRVSDLVLLLKSCMNTSR